MEIPRKGEIFRVLPKRIYRKCFKNLVLYSRSSLFMSSSYRIPGKTGWYTKWTFQGNSSTRDMSENTELCLDMKNILLGKNGFYPTVPVGKLKQIILNLSQ